MTTTFQMTTTFFGVIGRLGIVISAVWLIIQLVKKQPKKLPLMCLAASLVLIVLCMPREITSDKGKENHTVTIFNVDSSAETTVSPETIILTPEPTATPKNSSAPVKVAKKSIDDVKKALYKNAGSFEYMEVEGDEATISVNVAESGLALEAVLIKSNGNFTEWRKMKKELQNFAQNIYKFVKDSGFEDTIVFVNLLNDQNKENSLIMYMNGILIYDAIDS